MKTGSAAMVLLALVGFSTAFLYWAYQTGRERHIYEVCPLDDLATIPIIHEFYTGRATRIDEGRIHVRWQPTRVLRRDGSGHFSCVGTFIAGVDQRYYLLADEHDLYVERAEFIEPLLLALEEADRGHPPPPEVERLLNEPGADRDRVLEFWRRLRGTGETAPTD